MLTDRQTNKQTNQCYQKHNLLVRGNDNNNETGSRSPGMRPRSNPPKMKNSTPDKIVAEKKKKNNEANWMVSNSAKLDRRTKQHTQFGVSASNGSRDMARTKSLRKKRKNLKKKKNNEANWMVSNSAQLDCRTKQHTQFGVSASNGSRDMARTKSWRKKK